MVLISVIMPCYNSESFIKESIESVLSQSYSNLELLICDDLSTDGSVGVVQNMASLDDRVTLLRNINQKGAVGARNTCLAEAKGDFIAFLDSDDIWHVDKLKIQLEYMESQGLDFCFTAYKNISEQGIFLNKVNCPRKHYRLVFNVLNYVGCLTVMLRSDSYGCIRQPYIKTRNDYAFWQVLLSKTSRERVGGLQDYLAYYRVNSYGLSASKVSALIYFFRVHNIIMKRSFIISLVYSVGYLLTSSAKRKVSSLYNFLLSHF